MMMSQETSLEEQAALEQIRVIEEQLLTLLSASNEHLRYNALDYMWPEDGESARTLYPKAMEFFDAGREYTQRMVCSGNQVGKTYMACTEMTFHLTGLYPAWWTGHKFDHPVDILFIGETAQSTRDVLQNYLLGDGIDIGSGMIPKHLIHPRKEAQSGTSGAVAKIRVKHASGGWSTATFMYHSQGRGPFQGRRFNMLLFDEEPPENIYHEATMRSITKGGRVVLTFTPLLGISKVVMKFLPKGRLKTGEHPIQPWKYIVNINMHEVPHLTEEAIEQQLADCPPHERKAREYGIPCAGAGAVFKADENQYVCDPFRIPPHWPRGYSFDFGTKHNAVIWYAVDPATGIIYLYDEVYFSDVFPAVIAQAIKDRGGDWMEGVIDPHATSRMPTLDSVLSIYGTVKDSVTGKRGLGLRLYPASTKQHIRDNLLVKLDQWMATGMLKIWYTMDHTLSEVFRYARDENGNLKDDDDHFIDCMCMMASTGLLLAKTEEEARGKRAISSIDNLKTNKKKSKHKGY